ncbi:hypothetical protein SAMN06265218_10916 [Fodinibius sediminis]|uniref:Uncharacterized protein n=1 Tax=Fodinibius sediminis TaxID=1214077 RepID=A0A521D964_9BACT|nr:hypothetical protein SAMN06265218_10916 [Fodinibius sediminis]
MSSINRYGYAINMHHAFHGYNTGVGHQLINIEKEKQYKA